MEWRLFRCISTIGSDFFLLAFYLSICITHEIAVSQGTIKDSLHIRIMVPFIWLMNFLSLSMRDIWSLLVTIGWWRHYKRLFLGIACIDWPWSTTVNPTWYLRVIGLSTLLRFSMVWWVHWYKYVKEVLGCWNIYLWMTICRDFLHIAYITWLRNGISPLCRGLDLCVDLLARWSLQFFRKLAV